MAAADVAAQLQQYDANRVTTTDALNDALKQYGVPEIRQNVAGLRTTVANTTSALNNVDPSVTGRTQGSLVTEAQRQRQVANERAPIAQQLQGFNTALGQGEQNLNEANNQATTLATNRVHDWETGRSALQSQYDTAYKAEQDAAQAEAQRQAAAESTRQFNASLAASNAKSSGSAKTPSTTDLKQNVLQQMNANKGTDGYVGNGTFANGLSEWVSAGGNIRSFWQAFGALTNPSHRSGYAGYNQR